MQRIANLLLERARTAANAPALLVKRDGAFVPLAWSDIARDVCRYTIGLQNLGVQPRDIVAQLSENRYQWLLCDLAIQCIGAVHVPIHASLTGAQVAFQLQHSGATTLLISGNDQAEKLNGGTDSPIAGLACYSYDSCLPSGGGLAIQQLEEHIRTEVNDGDLQSLNELAATNTSPDSIATILYTSGTTGHPRGVALTHGNLLFNATSMVRSSRQLASDVKLNFLPLSHIYARTSDFYTWIVCGNQLALAESRETVLDDCAAIRPTWINAVPYFYDRVRRRVQDALPDHQQAELGKIFGDRMRILHSGGAPVSTATAEFFQSNGFSLYEGYGLTEASPVITTSRPGQIKRAAVGKPLDGVEVKITADGEILTRGPHVMAGYWRDDEATRETIRDGWLHTGDTGYLDEEGFLTLTGRKKEIIVTTGGKNIAPAGVEMRLAEDTLIHQVIVVGDGRDYLTALIVPNRDAVCARLRSRGVVSNPESLALTDARAIRLIEQCVAEQLADLSHYEQVRKFKLLERPFTVEGGELTLKRSLRRNVILERYAAEIQSLY